VLVVVDFSPLEGEGANMQDLIFTKYTHDERAHDGLRREYRHFVGNPGDTNNISFVAGCWKECGFGWIMDQNISRGLLLSTP